VKVEDPAPETPKEETKEAPEKVKAPKKGRTSKKG
jgi:hypothetical protein